MTTKKLPGAIINALVIGAAADRPELLAKGADMIDELGPDGDVTIEIANAELAAVVRFGADVAADREEVRKARDAALAAGFIARLRIANAALGELERTLGDLEDTAENVMSETLDRELTALAAAVARIGALVPDFIDTNEEL